MPRMSKKRKLEWQFFLNQRSRMTYNPLCRKCAYGCKQSFQAVVMDSARVINPNEPKGKAVIRCKSFISWIDGLFGKGVI